jgi:L-fuconolactonase
MRHNRPMTRRTLLGGVAASGAAELTPVVDTHIHFYDPTRPGGVPWPPPNGAVPYQPMLPRQYREVTKSLPIVGAIEVECSPLVEDNRWVLDVAAKDTLVVGTVGNLDPGQPEFRQQLDRFRKAPLFRGIRCGNLWGRDLHQQLVKPAFVADLKFLAQAGLTLDTADPDLQLLQDVLEIANRVPDLRVVIDHLPQLAPPAQAPASGAYKAAMRELGQRPKVYVKVSEVLRRVNGRMRVDLPFYRERLDEIWDTFGPDRLLYGSDWPNSDQWAPLPVGFALVREYFAGKGKEASEKYFWKNSLAVYRWVKRANPRPR